MKDQKIDIERVEEVYFSLLLDVARNKAEESNKPLKQIMMDLIEEGADELLSSNLRKNEHVKKKLKTDLEEAWPLEQNEEVEMNSKWKERIRQAQNLTEENLSDVFPAEEFSIYSHAEKCFPELMDSAYSTGKLAEYLLVFGLKMEISSSRSRELFDKFHQPLVRICLGYAASETEEWLVKLRTMLQEFEFQQGLEKKRNDLIQIFKKSWSTQAGKKLTNFLVKDSSFTQLGEELGTNGGRDERLIRLAKERMLMPKLVRRINASIEEIINTHPNPSLVKVFLQTRHVRIDFFKKVTKMPAEQVLNIDLRIANLRREEGGKNEYI